MSHAAPTVQTMTAEMIASACMNSPPFPLTQTRSDSDPDKALRQPAAAQTRLLRPALNACEA